MMKMVSQHPDWDGTVWIVTSPNGDIEVLDGQPTWDWVALGQTVRIANINGGDSAPVIMPSENIGK